MLNEVIGPAGRNEQVTGINILRNKPSILSTLQKNVRAIRAVLHRAHGPLSRRLAHHPRCATPSVSGPREAAEPRDPSGGPRSTVVRYRGRGAPSAGGARAGRVEARPSIRLTVTAALSCKECERSAAVIKAAVAKVLAKRPRAIQGSPILLSLPVFLLSVYTCTLPQSDTTLQYLYYSNARMQLSIHRLAPSSVKRH